MSIQYCPIHHVLFDTDVDADCCECEADGHDPDCAQNQPPKREQDCNCGVLLQ